MQVLVLFSRTDLDIAAVRRLPRASFRYLVQGPEPQEAVTIADLRAALLSWIVTCVLRAALYRSCHMRVLRADSDRDATNSPLETRASSSWNRAGSGGAARGRPYVCVATVHKIGRAHV